MYVSGRAGRVCMKRADGRTGVRACVWASEQAGKRAGKRAGERVGGRAGKRASKRASERAGGEGVRNRRGGREKGEGWRGR